MKAALYSLSAELDDLCQIFWSVLKCVPKREVSSFVPSFGPKRFVIHTYLFCNIPMSLLLQQTIIGENLFKLRTFEIIHKRNKTVVLHITTAKRLQDLFSVQGICPVVLKEQDLIYSINPKVFFKIIPMGLWWIMTWQDSSGV